MKYIITGSLGHISRPLTQALIAAGHEATVVTSSDARTADIKAIGAEAAVGSIEDRDFLTKTFAGADGVYLMIPPPPPTVQDWPAFQRNIADNYIAATAAHKVKYVTLLSSTGAHRSHGSGPIDGAAYLEEQAKTLTGANILVLRPTFFYPNLFAQIGMIKHAGFVGSTQPADFKLVQVSPADIAAVAAKYLVAPSFTGTVIEYVASDDSHTWADVTKILGAAIGKPELPYVELTDEQSKAGMLQAGMPAPMVEGFTAMSKALREGKVLEEYWKNRPTLGKVKFEDFVKEFVGAYNAG